MDYMCLDSCWKFQLRHILGKLTKNHVVPLVVYCTTRGLHLTLLNNTRFDANNPLHLLIVKNDGVDILQIRSNKRLLRTHVPSI